MKIAYVIAVALYTVVFLGITLQGLFFMAVHHAQFFHPAGGGNRTFENYLLFISGANAAIQAAPAWLVSSRWLKTRRAGVDFLPPSFREASRIGYVLGELWVFLGHLVVVGTMALIIFYAVFGGGTGLSLGVYFGIAIWFYALGILCVEISIRRWQR